MDSILTDSLETPKLDISLEEPDAIASSVSSGFFHSVSILSDNSMLQLAPSICTHKLWCQASALLDTERLLSHLHVDLVDTFSSLPEAEGDVIPVSEVHDYFSRFMAFCTRLFPSELEIHHVF